MRQFLSAIEEEAIKLDNMKRGANISSIAGSSVGLTGGILTIVSLALTPVTLGASLALTITGVSLGVTSGVNSLVTGITDTSVNAKCEAKACALFKDFVQDIDELSSIVENVAKLEIDDISLCDIVRVMGIGAAAAGIGRRVVKLVDAAEAVKAVNTAKSLAEVSRAIAKGSRSTIVLNALFIGVDAFFICRDSVNLAKRAKNDIAQGIRSNLDLWLSELDSWERIWDSLKREIGKFKEKHEILNRHFSPSIVY